VAYHEAGHAIAGWFLEHAHPLLKVFLCVLLELYTPTFTYSDRLLRDDLFFIFKYIYIYIF
jgi:hypothetical protein